ncbi:MAG: glycosyltransferase [Actinomycetota bacterium]
MLRSVNVGRKALADYYSIVSRDLMAQIRALAEPLAGKRVLHVNATAFGGGVSEILFSLVPLMNDIGLHAEWKVLFGREEFFHVTKRMHNALQGADLALSNGDRAVFERYNLLNAGGLSEEYDFIVVHDPQPAALRQGALQDRARWVWRCHIDLSSPNPEVLEFLLPYLEGYDLSVFHMAGYIPPDGRIPEPVVMPPAIDPLSPKNMSLSPEDAAYIVDQFGLDVERPLMVQVSRFDPWKDPLGVIDAYRQVRAEVPGLQLALVGSMATDDPEGWEYFGRTTDYAGDDPDIFILSNLNNVGSVEVNAFQTHADVVVQKSVREGFGLTVTEALWKSRPTVAGNVGGIPLQVVDGETGWLVSSAEECAARCLQVLRDPETARAMARKGKQHVRHDFLTPRLLRDWLTIFTRLTTDGG